MSAGLNKEVTGLTIVGTESGCGKTVFMTGLSALLRQQGVNVRAVKPICLGAKERAEAEISFICSISRTPRNYSSVVISSAKNLTNAQWTHSLSIGLGSGLTLVETPGSCASPMSFEQNSVGTLAHAWKDSRDFACELNYPCIIVAHHNHEAIEKLVMAYTYMKDFLPIAGLVTVETKADEGKQLESRLTRSEVALLLASRTRAPYLGCLKFSPSISVPRVNQGNLVKVTAEGIDLLLILKTLNLGVVK